MTAAVAVLTVIRPVSVSVSAEARWTLEGAEADCLLLDAEDLPQA